MAQSTIDWNDDFLNRIDTEIYSPALPTLSTIPTEDLIQELRRRGQVKDKTT